MSCINQILEFYYNDGQYKDPRSDYIQIWFNNMLIQLTSDKFARENDSLRIRNCLILLINLFTGISEIDHFNIKGKSLLDLSLNEKNEMDEAIRTAISSEN